MNNVRFAVLGLGRQGYRHALNLAAKVKGAEVAAVVDALPEVAERVARELEVSVYGTSPEAVIERDDVDAVVVVTPTDTHARLAKAVAAAGKALFIEKPLSLDLDEAASVVQAVEVSGVYCQLGFMRRFDPAYAEAKRRIRAGDIGEPLYFKAVSRDPLAPPEGYIAVSGGIFLDQAIHDFDVARFLMQDEVSEVTAMGSVLYTKAAEQYGDVDQGLTYLRFAGGAAGDVESYRNAFYGYDIRAEVLGTEGTLAVTGLQQHNVTLLKPGSGSYDVLPGFLERFREAYILEMEAFVSAVREGKPSHATARDGYEALAIGVAATQSRRTQTVQRVASYATTR